VAFPGASGPSATFPGGSNTATIDASGQAAIAVAANANAGSYTSGEGKRNGISMRA
jgi:hypothetical protein